MFLHWQLDSLPLAPPAKPELFCFPISLLVIKIGIERMNFRKSCALLFLIVRKKSKEWNWIVWYNKVSIQLSCSVVSDSVIPWSVASQFSLSITNSQSLLKLMFIELVMPSNHLILCRPLFLPPSVFSSIRIFSNESVSSHQVAKVWEFQLQPQSFQWIFRIDFL